MDEMWNRLRAAVSRMVVGGSVRGGRDRRRQRQNWSTETVECRCLLSGSAIGDLVQTYPVTVQFSESGHLGDSRVFGDTLFIPGTRDDGAPIAWIVNLNTGATEARVFAGSGNISGVNKRNGEFVFTGFLDTTTGRKVTYWDDAGEHASASQGDTFDVSSLGRVVGTKGAVDAFYYDVGADSAVLLPGKVNMYVGANSITGDGQFIGGGAFNDDLDFLGIVYEQQSDGSYDLLDVQYVTPEGLSSQRMNVVDGPEGPLGVGIYTDVNGAVQTALWGVKDGVYKTRLGAGYVAAAVYQSGYLFASTDQGIVTATDLATLQTETYTAAALFGSTKDFSRVSLFVTADGNLGVIGTDPVTKLATVKTFEVLENTAPVVSAWDGTTSFVENSLPVVLDANVSVVDADSADFAGGTVTVSFAANGTAADRLSVRHVGNSAGQIGVSGNNISFGGVLIGTKSGGTNGSTPLVVTLNAAANSSAVTALLQAISFQNVSESPSTAARRVQVVVADGDGGTSAAVSKLVTVTAVNDAPVIAAFDGAVTYTENAVPVLVDSNASVSDADGLNIGGGMLTVAITANGKGTDRLAIRNIGTGAGQISVSGNTIKLGSVICATFSGGTNGFSPLVVTLAPSATTASATSILRALTFASVSENPSVLPRTIRVRITDKVGALSAPVFKTVSVRAVNDAPVIRGWDLPLSAVGNANPMLLDSNAAITDVDSSNFSGGKLTLWISANAHRLDRLTVRSLGNSAGQIGVSGSSVRFGGVLIGTFVGGTSGTVPLVVTLNSSATTAAVTALLRSLTYKFAGTSSLRVIKTVSVSLSDGDGGLSSVARKNLTLERTL